MKTKYTSNAFGKMLLSALLSAVLVVGLAPNFAWAQDAEGAAAETGRAEALEKEAAGSGAEGKTANDTGESNGSAVAESPAAESIAQACGTEGAGGKTASASNAVPVPEAAATLDDAGDGSYYDPYVDDPFADYIPIPIPEPTEGLVYNGEYQKGVLAGTGYVLTPVPLDEYYYYSDQTAVIDEYGNALGLNAGGYTVVASLLPGYCWDYVDYFGQVDVQDQYLWFQIDPQEIDVSGVKFEDATFSYDGTEHQIVCSNLPKGVTVDYVDNKMTLPGIQLAEAYLLPADEQNYRMTGSNYLQASLVVLRGRMDLSNVKFEDKTVVYDGNFHTIEVENLPDGVSSRYSFEDYQFCLPGSYPIVVTLESDLYYPEVLGAVLTILWPDLNETDTEAYSDPNAHSASQASTATNGSSSHSDPNAHSASKAATTPKTADKTPLAALGSAAFAAAALAAGAFRKRQRS